MKLAGAVSSAALSAYPSWLVGSEGCCVVAARDETGWGGVVSGSICWVSGVALRPLGVTTRLRAVTHDYIRTGAEIYARSFEIIREESNLERFPDDVEFVAVRMIHAAADPAIADSIAFSPGVARTGLAALEAGAPILCDSSMVASGIIRSRLPEHTQIVCHIKDPRLAELAQQRNSTKAAAAVDLWHQEGLLDGGIVAIGNAPTALFRVLEIMKETGARPAAIVGIPVGFVGAAESKDALVADPCGAEYITVLGRRGGSAMTVAAVNAIASRAETTNDRS